MLCNTKPPLKCGHPANQTFFFSDPEGGPIRSLVYHAVIGILIFEGLHTGYLEVCARTTPTHNKQNVRHTVKPQSYGLHSYGKLGQPDAEIELIFGKYRQHFYKISIKWERVIKFSSVTQSFSFNISQLMLHSDHSCTFFMENVQNSIKS